MAKPKTKADPELGPDPEPESALAPGDRVVIVDGVPRLMVPLDSIFEDLANANVHDDADITGLMAKLATFGQVEPLVIQSSTRKIIGGNGRMHAMRRLGWQECWVNLESCDNVTATAMGIALNTRKSHLDEPTLAKHLRALQSEGFNLVATGFEDADVDRMLERLGGQIAGEVVDDPQGEWEGMPEYGHDDLSPFQSIHLHFRNALDRDEFARLIGQKLTDATKFAWYPIKPIEPFGHVAHEPQVSDLRDLEGSVGIEADGQGSGEDGSSLSDRRRATGT